jgi:hypothetical protein
MQHQFYLFLFLIILHRASGSFVQNRCCYTCSTWKNLHQTEDDYDCVIKYYIKTDSCVIRSRLTNRACRLNWVDGRQFQCFEVMAKNRSAVVRGFTWTGNSEACESYKYDPEILWCRKCNSDLCNGSDEFGPSPDYLLDDKELPPIIGLASRSFTDNIHACIVIVLLNYIYF